MTKLIEETVKGLEELDKTPAMVEWVGSRDGQYAMAWEEFVKQFADLDYDDGFGRQEIANDLVVVGENWWLERHEYDGSEWWEFKELPVRREDPKPFNKIEGAWDSLAEIMGGKENEDEIGKKIDEEFAKDSYRVELAKADKELLEGMGFKIVEEENDKDLDLLFGGEE